GALEVAPEQRPAFLDQACLRDDSLRHEVESLLASADTVGSDFLPSSTLHLTLAKGTVLGDYEVQSLIGTGGMGEVYRARDCRLDRDVAIKVLPIYLSSNRDRLWRFEQEARVAAALNHPNILAVFQMGTYEGASYLVTELLDGLTVREHLRCGPLPVPKAIDYALQIANGLAAAHKKGIVHRDLKPENLFVTKDGCVKILDFGLAKLMQSKADFISARRSDQRTEAGMVMGTAGYMAPEQARGEDADYRADIFAFGAILYEMLTGKRAFEGPTAADTMGAILRDESPAFPRTVPAPPPGLQRIMQRCLEKDQEQRFHSASDLAFALQSLSDGNGSEKQIASSASEFLDSIAVLPFENAGGEPETEYLSDGITTSIINMLSQLHKLRVVPRTTVFRYKGKVSDVAKVGRRLRVRVALTGQVTQRGNGLIVNAELIDTIHDSQLWGANYYRTLEEILPVQTEIAGAVTDRLRLQLNDEERKQLAKRPTHSREAYCLYLKAIYWANKWTPEGFQKGIEYCRQASEADPAYADAYVALGYL